MYIIGILLPVLYQLEIRTVWEFSVVVLTGMSSFKDIFDRRDFCGQMELLPM